MLTREQAVKKLANKLIAMMERANCYLVKDYKEIRALEATALRSLDGVVVSHHSDAVDLLSQLVAALDRAFISSWQSTTAWSKELTRARDWLAAAPNATQAPINAAQREVVSENPKLSDALSNERAPEQSPAGAASTMPEEKYRCYDSWGIEVVSAEYADALRAYAIALERKVK